MLVCVRRTSCAWPLIDVSTICHGHTALRAIPARSTPRLYLAEALGAFTLSLWLWLLLHLVALNSLRVMKDVELEAQAIGSLEQRQLVSAKFTMIGQGVI